MFSLLSWGRLQFKSSSSNKSWFTLTELIVVITILSILSVIGFTVMSHQSSVARDGKRISDIQTLSQSAKITSAQLRLLPTPIADSVSLTVSGTFIGYQGFMSLALVNPLGYGSDKIFDPKDNIPYTYRVNQHYDSAQFMAYLENPRFERSIEIAKNQFLRNEEVGMNGEWFDGNQEVGMNGFGEWFDNREQLNGGWFDGKKIQEIASQSLPSVLSSTLSSALPSTLPSLFSQAYALDSSTTDLSSRYPYSAGDRLGIFLSKGSNQPLQNGVTGTGSRDISLSDTSTLSIIVGSSWADGYVSTDISTWSLLSLKDGSFDEKALLGMNGGSSGSSGSGSGGGSGSGSGSGNGYVLTIGEYSIGGSPVYGYIGQWFLSGPYGPAITTITAGNLTPTLLDGKQIDSIFFFQGQQLILMEDGSSIPHIVISEGSQNSDCIADSIVGNVQIFECESVSIVWPYTVGETRTLGIESTDGSCPTTPTDESYFTFDSNNGTVTDYDSINGPKNVVIPSTINGINVTTIGNDALMQKWLTCLLIPNTVTNIGDNAFNQNWLTSVVIPDNVVTIGHHAFYGNQLNSVTISDSVVNIGDNAFNNNQLSSLVLPSNITSIGNYVFASNQLTSIAIPNSVTDIGEGTFQFNQLSSLVLPSSITSIGDFAFNVNQLTSVTIPNSVTNIGDFAFRSNQLTSLIIPSGITSIWTATFEFNQISSLTIPSNITNIGNNAFSSNQLTSLIIPETITTISDWAFSLNQLTSLIIPDHVTSIWDGAFQYNYYLTSLTIGSGVTSIWNYAFRQNNISSLIIGSSVTSIWDQAFRDNNLTSLIIPSNVESIWNFAFRGNHIPSVNDVTVYCDLPTFWTDVFGENPYFYQPTTCTP